MIMMSKHLTLSFCLLSWKSIRFIVYSLHSQICFHHKIETLRANFFSQENFLSKYNFFSSWSITKKKELCLKYARFQKMFFFNCGQLKNIYLFRNLLFFFLIADSWKIFIYLEIFKFFSSDFKMGGSTYSQDTIATEKQAAQR